MSEPIEVVPYDPKWPKQFAELATGMRAELRDTALRIDHIGSTAVPGLDAKPIIDIQISVAALEPVDAFRIPLEKLRFVFRPDNPELTKRYFREAAGQKRTHIHVRRAGSWNEQFALLFRDYLRSSPDDIRRYAELKRSLAASYRHERSLYVEAKEPFIWKVMQRANAWAQATGWQPGPSDV
jgi:GrpB-like predicted nucleotidyltransferase (UPF0157 family)